MGALIMSLLFLTNILEPFQALDDSGRALPEAVLTFWQSGTSKPAAVYADQELDVVLSDDGGRVTADNSGMFPLIYLDPDVLYRVRLTTARGVLRWDVDPYVCDCTDPPRVFRSPVHQALTPGVGLVPTFEPPPVAGALLYFTDPDDDTPRTVYADAARTAPLTNPVRANAGGFFAPIYLDDAVEYHVRLTDADGAPLLDVDPYECDCGFLLLTSRPYPVEQTDALNVEGHIRWRFNAPALVEGLGISSILVGGSMPVILITYEDGEPEALEVSASFLSGSLGDITLVTYEDGEPEAIDVTAGLVGGSLDTILITYANGVPEALAVSGRLISGALGP